MPHGNIHEHDQKPSDAISRFFRTGVFSVSERILIGRLSCARLLPALRRGIISRFTHRRYYILAEAVPSTPMEFVSRLTEHELRP